MQPSCMTHIHHRDLSRLHLSCSGINFPCMPSSPREAGVATQRPPSASRLPLAPGCLEASTAQRNHRSTPHKHLRDITRSDPVHHETNTSIRIQNLQDTGLQHRFNTSTLHHKGNASPPPQLMTLAALHHHLFSINPHALNETGCPQWAALFPKKKGRQMQACAGKLQYREEGSEGPCPL